MEMRRYRKILGISYKDHVTNDEVSAKIQQAIGPHEDLLTIIKRRKLRWYGYVSNRPDIIWVSVKDHLWKIVVKPQPCAKMERMYKLPEADSLENTTACVRNVHGKVTHNCWTNC